uniref:Uncharacterized protein n=1 Tax=Ciona savignyi TaxID=51511 RepID=H2Z574_CIOSA
MQSKTRPNPSETKVPTNPYLQAMKKTMEKEKIKPNNTNGVKKKPPPDPYAELLEKAKQASASTQCTLSVSSAGVRTNYPSAQRNNDFPRPSSASRGPRSAAEEYRRRLAAAQGRSLSRGFPNPATLRRHQVLDSDEDEYDSEMEGFIDDDDGMDEAGNDISAQIGAIFGYNRNKYGRESEYELSKMDASYKDIEKEEKRSLRIAKEEDAKEARLEEERNRRAMMKKAKK